MYFHPSLPYLQQYQNAIMIATIADKLDTVKFLSSHGVNIDYQTPSPQCWNALFYAIANKRKEIAEYCMLCGLSPCQRNAVDNYGFISCIEWYFSY